jgi:hypothetical protein
LAVLEPPEHFDDEIAYLDNFSGQMAREFLLKLCGEYGEYGKLANMANVHAL